MNMRRGILCALILIVAVRTVKGRAEFQVNGYTQHHQTCPSVAMNGDGDSVIAWRSDVVDGRGGGVYARRFQVDGTPAGEEFQVAGSAVDVANWAPAVGISASGDSIVVWVAVDGDDRDIMARMFDAQGQPLTEEFQVNGSPDKGIQSVPCLSMNAVGDFVVAWTCCVNDEGRPRSHIVGRVYHSDGSPASEEFRISELTQARMPDVAMDDSGRFVVTWIRMGDTFNRPYGEYVMFRRFEADASPIGETVTVTTDLNSRWYGPAVAMDPTGQFALVWAVGPFPYDIVMQSFDAEGIPITLPYIINTCIEGNQGHPRIAVNGHGEYLVVWDSQGQDGSCHGIFGQLCNGFGDLDGGELALNSYVTGRQWYPDAAMSRDGKYLVVWVSEGQDGSGYGIAGETGGK